MNEEQLINELIKDMPRSNNQLNKVFESDSEIIRGIDLDFSGQNLLFSTDEFSDEDLFNAKDPLVLGHNIAVGALTDIYASGGEPLFYAHSLAADDKFNKKYLQQFYKGIGEVLKEAGVSFIGGDFGKAKAWRCTTSVIGRAKKPLLRSTARVGDAIYITGQIGGGNILAAAKLMNIDIAKIKFHLPIKEANTIREVATSCMDTSDGLFQAVNMIAQMSRVGFALDNLPYHKLGGMVAKLLGLPKELLFFCECGEYELVFTAPKEIKLPFYKIGEITRDKKTLYGKDISGFNLRAREFEDPKDYLKAVKSLCEGLL